MLVQGSIIIKQYIWYGQAPSVKLFEGASGPPGSYSTAWVHGRELRRCYVTTSVMDLNCCHGCSASADLPHILYKYTHVMILSSITCGGGFVLLIRQLAFACTLTNFSNKSYPTIELFMYVRTTCYVLLTETFVERKLIAVICRWWRFEITRQWQKLPLNLSLSLSLSLSLCTIDMESEWFVLYPTRCVSQTILPS